jgi:TP901 family phage tail tape measure protein
VAEPIDVAYVEVRPDTRGFGAETRRQLNRELRGVERDLGVAQAAGRGSTLGETLLGTAIGADLGIKAAENDIAKLGGTAARSSAQTGQLASALSVLGGSASRAGQAARVTGIGAAAIGGAAFLAARSAIAFEDSFAGVRKTVDATEPQLQRMADDLLDLSTVIPVNVNELNNLASAAGQLGIETDAIIAFTETVAKLGVTTDLASDVAADALARLANITQLPQDQFENLGSTIVALGNRTAATESEIVDFGLRISGAGHQIGLTQDQIVAFGAALASVGLNAEAGGSAISTTFVRIASDGAKGGARLDEFARLAGMSSAEFAKRFRSEPAQAIVAFLRGLGQVNEEGGNVFATLDQLGLGGIRVRDALLRSAGAGDLLSEALRIGNQAWKDNNALQREAAIRFDTTKSGLTDVKNEASALAVELGTGLLPIIDALAGGLSTVFGGTRKGVRFLKDLVSPEFDVATASIEEITTALGRAEQEVADFKAIGGDDTVADGMKKALVELEEQAGKTAAALASGDTWMTQRTVQAFRDASTEIDTALRDGILSPMEASELKTSALGRAFVRMIGTISDETSKGILGAVQAASTVGTRLGEALAAAIRAQKANVRNAVLDTVTGLQGQTAGFGEQFDIATAAGDEQGQLAALKQQAQRQQSIVDRINKATGGDPKGDLLAKRRQAQSALASLNTQIRSIEESIQAEKDQEKKDREAREKKDRDDAEERLRKANQNALAIRNTNVELARLTTDRVDDDRIAYGSLIKELRRQLDIVGAATAEGRSLLLQIKQAKGELSNALQENTDAEVSAREEFLRDQLTLAQLTGGTGEQALRRLETFYEKQVAASKAGSVARRKWRIELERVRKELRDIAEEEGKTAATGKALQPGRMFFEFMQTQQGFVSNLLSNLIPSGSTAGLVGGTVFPGGRMGASPSDALVDLEAERAARGPRGALVTAGVTGDGRKGMTAGQAQTLISLNRQMLGVLRDVHKTTGHPEASARAVASKALMDIL